MGAGDFESYYSRLYGKRWPALKAALQGSADTVGYGEGLLEPYYLDRGSVIAAETLRLCETGTILDACAAPGGKTLVIASRMGADTRLLANELSSERRRRLVDVLNRHLGGPVRERVTVSGFDAAAQGGRSSERGRFAAVLLDAPCSSERHVLQDGAALEQWTESRPRFLARRQWALLSSAFLLLEEGGCLVYATCALSEEENDGTAGRLIKKYAGGVELDPPDFTEGEATEWGRILLPDSSGGMGPMYVARFRKHRA